MKTIVVCVDFSAQTLPVLEEARSLALAFEAEVRLLHVAAPEPDFVGYEVGPQSVRDSRATELKDEHHQLEDMACKLTDQGVKTRAYLIPGMTAECILEHCQKWEADLVVMGSHGHGTVRAALVGSVSGAVLKDATCPVLVIPRGMVAP